MTLLVRDEAPGEAPAVRAVVAAAFGRNAEADLVESLRRDGDAVLSLVAEAAGAPVGHILFSRMAAPFRALALAPVSVVPDRQGRGIGGLLIETGLARAADDGWDAAILLGDPGYYRRFGFDPALAEPLACRYSGPHLMARTLRDGAPPLRGRIAFAPAFEGLEGD